MQCSILLLYYQVLMYIHTYNMHSYAASVVLIYIRSAEVVVVEVFAYNITYSMYTINLLPCVHICM